MRVLVTGFSKQQEGKMRTFLKEKRLFFLNLLFFFIGLVAGMLTACRLEGSRALFFENCLRLFFFDRENYQFFSVFLSFLGLELIFWFLLYPSGFIPLGRYYSLFLLMVKGSGYGLVWTGLTRLFFGDGMLLVYGMSFLPDLLATLLFLLFAVNAQKLADRTSQNIQKEQVPQNLYPFFIVFHRRLLLLVGGLLIVQLAKSLLGIWLLPMVAVSVGG